MATNDQKLEWLKDEPLQCAFYPEDGTERCTKDTKMMAFGSNGTSLYWFPICQECFIEHDSMFGWQVAHPYGVHDADVSAE